MDILLRLCFVKRAKRSCLFSYQNPPTPSPTNLPAPSANAGVNTYKIRLDVVATAATARAACPWTRLLLTCLWRYLTHYL